MIIQKATVEVLSAERYEDMLRRVERIGRVCYKSEDRIQEGSAEAFIRGILRRGHESVIEHGSITVKFICDRGVTHEIVRHRIASYSQESTRYCNYASEKFGREINCVDPSGAFGWNEGDMSDQRKAVLWREAMVSAERTYFALLEAGARPEEARSVLPNSLKTEIVITMNLREWRHFFRLRCSRRAHPQMAEVAWMLLRTFAERWPIFFEDLLSYLETI